MPDNTCICCGAIIPEGRQICLHCGDYDDMQTFRPRIRPKPRTNGDRIRAMTNRELAEFISEEQFDAYHNAPELVPEILEWLESEVQND